MTHNCQPSICDDRVYVHKNVHLPVTYISPDEIFTSLWESLDINEIAEGCHGGDLSVRLPGRGNGVQWCGGWVGEREG